MADGVHSSELSDALPSELPPPVIDAWSVAVAVVGVSLWAQCFWTPLAARLQAGAAEPWRVLPLVVPLGAVGAALVWRAVWVRLFAVPVSLVPGMLMVPAQEMTLSGYSALRIASTFGIYLVCAGLSLRRDQQNRDWLELEDDETDPGASGSSSPEVHSSGARQGERPAGLYPYFMRTRLIWMVLLFGAFVWGVFVSAPTQALIAEHFGENRYEARMFLTVLMTFVWCVGVYIGTLRPVASVEYRLRKRRRRLKDRPAADAAKRRLGYRAILGVIGIIGVALFAV